MGILIIVATAYHELLAPKNTTTNYLNHNVKITGILTNDVEYKKDDYRLQLDTDIGKVYVMLESEPHALRSDRLELEGKLEPGFGNYAAFLYRPRLVSISRPSTPDFSLALRDWFAQNVKTQIVDEEQSSLALSYLTGQKILLSEEQKQKLRFVGLAHVVVASGYHLSVVVGLAKKYLGKISRFATFGGAIILLVIYISITGFSPSMARAGLITFLSLWAWYFGRKFHPARSIIYVAAITLIIDPSYISNLAWQLSFASYAGIMFFSPVLAKFFYGDKTPNYLASLILASISAQLLCLPLSIYNFGQIPALAILANVLITPIIPLIMLLTFLTGVTTFSPFAFVVSKLLAFQISIINWLASLKWASIEIGAGNPLSFLIYLPILIILLILKWRTKHHFHPGSTLAESPDYGKIYAC